jgi:hypothetical protein
MRTQQTKTRLKAWMFAPLLVACDATATGGGDQLAQVPDCIGMGQTGTVLSTDSSGQLVCKKLPDGTVTIPVCNASEALTSNGSSLTCVNKDTGDTATQSAIDKLNRIEMLLQDYGTTYNMLNTGTGARAVYVGVSQATPDGRVSDGAGGIGAGAASKVCEQQYGMGARVCTVYDMYYSVASAKIVAATNVPRSWVYMQSWKNPAGGVPADATQGLNDNCADFIYNTGDKRWQGTAVTWATTALNNVDKALHFTNTACSTTLPLACCK